MAKKVKNEAPNPIGGKKVDEGSVEAFAQAIVDGYTQAQAYRISHPQWKSNDNAALRVKGCNFASRQDVAERIAEIRKETHERHAGFRDRLVDMLQEEISTCYRDNKTLSPVMKQAELAARVLGMDKQVIDLKADVTAVDAESVADKLNFLAKKAGGK